MLRSLILLFLTVSTPAMALDTVKELLGIEKTKFKWSASSSAPKGYPMTIIAANLNYPGGAEYVGASSSTDSGWGEPDSGSGGGIQPVPRVLDILFFSYTENQFYRGNFDLPYDKILSLFQKGFYSPNNEKHITYDNIIVGVAPGALWRYGSGVMKRLRRYFLGRRRRPIYRGVR